jgi:hypothetical protein
MHKTWVQVLIFLGLMGLLVGAVWWANRPRKSPEAILAGTRADFYGKKRTGHAGGTPPAERGPVPGPSEFSSLTDD